MKEIMLNRNDLELISKVLKEVKSSNCLVFILIGRDYYFYEIHEFEITSAILIDVYFDTIKFTTVNHLKEIIDYVETKKCPMCNSYHFMSIHIFTFDIDYKTIRFVGTISPSTNIPNAIKDLIIKEDKKDKDVKVIDFRLFEHREQIDLY